jgi:hypothetical protein
MTRLILSLAALGLLAGCGIPGGLERPGPMWNSEEALRHECTRELRRGENRDSRCEQTQQTPPQTQPPVPPAPTPVPQQPQTQTPQ